jgi:hypothetical protein
VALAGESYRKFVEGIENVPGTPETWARVEAANIAAIDRKFGLWADSKLATLGFLVDDDSSRRVIEETGAQRSDAAFRLETGSERNRVAERNASRSR